VNPYDYETCSHISGDVVIETNGGRFHLTHWLRVKEARTVADLTRATAEAVR